MKSNSMSQEISGRFLDTKLSINILEWYIYKVHSSPSVAVLWVHFGDELIKVDDSFLFQHTH